MLKAFRVRLALLSFVSLVALLAACGSADSGDDAAAGPGSQGPGPEPQGGGSGDDFGRRIVRTAEIDLAINSLNEALTDIRAIARDAGGFVADSHIVVSDSDDAQAARPERAVMTLRVPAAVYDETMERLRGIASGVDSEETSVTEVTAEYTDLEARLRNLEAAEQSYLALLERAESIDEILRVQENVNEVRGEIEQVQGQLNVLDNQTALAAITVNLRLVTAPAPGQHWAVRAWEASWSASEALVVVLGSVAIAGLFASVWVAPPLIVGYVVWRRFGASLAALARRLS